MKHNTEQLDKMSLKITELTMILKINQAFITEMDVNMAVQAVLTYDQKDKMRSIYHASEKALKDN